MHHKYVPAASAAARGGGGLRETGRGGDSPVWYVRSSENLFVPHYVADLKNLLLKMVTVVDDLTLLRNNYKQRARCAIVLCEIGL
jgi:hypothetical protein